MKIYLYAVRDQSVSAFLTPFFFKTDAEARRGFGTMVEDKETLFGRYPEDFILFRIGVFDDETGELAEDNQKVCSGFEFVKPSEPVLKEVK